MDLTVSDGFVKTQVVSINLKRIIHCVNGQEVVKSMEQDCYWYDIS